MIGGDDASIVLEGMRPSSWSSQGLFDTLKAEALFGWNEISPSIRASDRCLEIGAGSGLLAALAARKARAVDALEPAPREFEAFRTILDGVAATASPNLRIVPRTLSEHHDRDGYDFIWSINVFEHIDDWRRALLKTVELLRPGGRALILCPNYDIPYESHFSLPIVWSKRMTRRLFARQIAAYERDHNSPGLWASVNMISASAVLRFARSQGITLTLDRTVTERMFNRFYSDPHFRNRHRLIRPLVWLIHRIELHRTFRVLPPWLQPYVAYHLSARR